MSSSDKSKLAAFGGTPILPKDFKHPDWPVINDIYKKVVTKQMDESMSIYNRSGIFEDFENKFATLHGAKYALLNNSGTNSLWAMFVGAGLGPGDEVICPTYTFFATNTPLLSSGVHPVFCDSGDDGNIDPKEIIKKIGPKTKAILITHMWGYPCKMDEIVSIAKDNNLLLFEDCSHAHLAKYKGKLVGSFGDAAAWSLQGQKNITGGEGGIIVTNNLDIYVRANLLGHYNKRCKDEIPSDHPLYKFAVTGMGLKLRAHPLAIAFADEQLRQHDKYQEMRNFCADEYKKLFGEYSFIEPIEYKDADPSWYAFVFKYSAPAESNISREEFVDLLHAEGLSEVDIPGSTGPNHLLPLFQEPSVLFPQFYETSDCFNTNETFPNAQKFYESIIKLPIWTQPEHRSLVRSYIEGLRKVLDHVSNNA